MSRRDSLRQPENTREVMHIPKAYCFCDVLERCLRILDQLLRTGYAEVLQVVQWPQIQALPELQAHRAIAAAQ